MVVVQPLRDTAQITRSTHTKSGLTLPLKASETIIGLMERINWLLVGLPDWPAAAGRVLYAIHHGSPPSRACSKYIRAIRKSLLAGWWFITVQQN